jgi:hypothetical protein
MTVTCLYSACSLTGASLVPHSLQNLAVGPDRAPQESQTTPVWVIVSLPVYFATELSSARARSISSYA